MTSRGRIVTGIPELDVVLRGGLLKGRIHLLEGRPGTGKTTIGMRLLISTAEQGGTSLYVALSETEKELRATADSHGWSLDGVQICVPQLLNAQSSMEQTIMLPSDVQLSKLIDSIVSHVKQTGAQTIVIDSMAEIRLLANDSSQYRRQIISLRDKLNAIDATVLLLDDLTGEQHEFELQSAVHGAITLEQLDQTYGAIRRRLKVVKLRGGDYQSGWHDFAITQSEILIFPSLIAIEHQRDYTPRELLSGEESLDRIMGGGLVDGTSTMIMGPAGIGKTTLALEYARAVAESGGKAAYFVLDEAEMTARSRMVTRFSSSDKPGDSDQILVHRINPSRISPGGFIWKVRRAVEDDNVRIVIIDSINSYMELVREERSLSLQMNELFSYLSNMGVIAIIIGAQSAALDTSREPDALSIITDNIVVLRFFEKNGQMSKAIAVQKKRYGKHSHDICAFDLTERGVKIGVRVEFPQIGRDTVG